MFSFLAVMQVILSALCGPSHLLSPRHPGAERQRHCAPWQTTIAAHNSPAVLQAPDVDPSTPKLRFGVALSPPLPWAALFLSVLQGFPKSANTESRAHFGSSGHNVPLLPSKGLFPAGTAGSSRILHSGPGSGDRGSLPGSEVPDYPRMMSRVPIETQEQTRCPQHAPCCSPPPHGAPFLLNGFQKLMSTDLPGSSCPFIWAPPCYPTAPP